MCKDISVAAGYPFVMNVAAALIERLVPKRWRDGDADAATDTSEGREEPDGAAETDSQDLSAAVPMAVDPSDLEVSNEALILRQLIAHNGRVRRSVLAETTDWPDEKLDAVLAEMEADAQISTLQRRDPLVCRRGFEPAGAPLRFND